MWGKKVEHVKDSIFHCFSNSLNYGRRLYTHLGMMYAFLGKMEKWKNIYTARGRLWARKCNLTFRERAGKIACCCNHLLQIRPLLYWRRRNLSFRMNWFNSRVWEFPQNRADHEQGINWLSCFLALCVCLLAIVYHCPNKIH